MALAEVAAPQQGSDKDKKDKAVLHEVARRARPHTLARDRSLPVLPALASLLPEGARRGSTIAVTGSVTLALAVLAGPSAAGSWAAIVGLPSLGVEAAAGVGVVLERLALVPEPGVERWPVVVAALLDELDIVLAVPPPHLRTAHARRLTARARERGGVLVVLGSPGPEPVDLQLTVTHGRWSGLGHGHGHLSTRQVEVVARGRRAAARERRARLWLPAPGGGVEAVERAEAEEKAEAKAG